MLWREALTTPQPVADHAGLHCAEQEQGPGAGIEANVGIREGYRVSEQCQRGAPAAERLVVFAAQAHYRVQRECTGNQADRREAGGVDAGVFERKAAQQRVGGERHQREQREREDAQGRHG